MITWDEFQIYGPVEKPANRQAVKNLARPLAKSFFRQELTYDLYQAMENARIDYTGVPQWSEVTAYTVGQQVEFMSNWYQCILNGTGKRPTDTTYWLRMPKFDEPEYETLWTEHLRTILCFVVAQSSIVYDAVKQAPNGAVRQESVNGSFSPVTHKDIQYYKSEISGDVRVMISEMKEYLKTRTVPGYAPSTDSTDCDTTTTRKVRRRNRYGFSIDG